MGDPVTMAVMAGVQGLTSQVTAQQQKKAIKEQRDAQLRQNMMQTREAEINRLNQLKQDLASNMAVSAVSGVQGATQENIMQGNITSAEKDINYISKFGSANEAAINKQASNQLKATRMSQAMGVLSAGASAGSAYTMGTKASTPTEQKLKPSTTNSLIN